MTRFPLGLLLVFAAAFGQSSLQTAFEIASVKPVEGLRGRMYDFSSSGPRVRYIAYATAQLISIFAAVQQQLGLKLEPQKVMIEVLVVDHVEKPSEN